MLVHAAGKCLVSQRYHTAPGRTNRLIQWVSYNNVFFPQARLQFLFRRNAAVCLLQRLFSRFQRTQYLHRHTDSHFQRSCQGCRIHTFTNNGKICVLGTSPLQTRILIFRPWHRKLKMLQAFRRLQVRRTAWKPMKKEFPGHCSCWQPTSSKRILFQPPVIFAVLGSRPLLRKVRKRFQSMS